MEITIEDIYGMKHILDTEKCREITFVHNKSRMLLDKDDSEAKRCSYFVEYWPIQAYDSEFIYITREEFLKNV